MRINNAVVTTREAAVAGRLEVVNNVVGNFIADAAFGHYGEPMIPLTALRIKRAHLSKRCLSLGHFHACSSVRQA